ncbi:hypothetical protein [Vibrio kanaloae]|jgi:hypothetical protein|nr:hypothetical protein [Vibrio kanaloae]
MNDTPSSKVILGDGTALSLFNQYGYKVLLVTGFILERPQL